MKINQITNETKNININAKLEKVILSTGSNGSNYLILHLADNSGRVEARLWNVIEKDKEELKSGTIVNISGVVNVFRQQLQIKVNNYEIIDNASYAKFGIKEPDFNIAAPIDTKLCFDNLIKDIKKIKNNTYKKLTLALLEEFKNDFLIFPAAISIHHNVVGGLLWHSMSLFNSIQGIKPIYDQYYSDIDWDLAGCGAVLHDIGKIIEIQGKNALDYTLEGKLLGHISIGNAMLESKAKELGIYFAEDNTTINEDLTKLQHIILSSHGKNEYGSPVEPSLIEGVIVSTFDNLDAKINTVSEELKKIKQGQWTQRINAIDGKMFYKHFMDAKK